MSHDHPHDHPHDHLHDHPHDHPHDIGSGAMPAGERPPMGGPVVLDIGDGVGALIVHLPGALVGQELYVRPAGRSEPMTHTGIWNRPIGGQHGVVAVFPELVEGRYEVLDHTGRPWVGTVVSSGRVTEFELTVEPVLVDA